MIIRNLPLIVALAVLPLAPVALAHPVKSNTPVHLACDGPLGTSVDLRIAGVDDTAAETAFQAVLAEAERLERILSTWRPETPASRLLSATTRQSVAPELLEVLLAAEHFRVLSGGAYDMRAGHICQRWQWAAKADRLPTPAEAATWAAEAAAGRWNIQGTRVQPDPQVRLTIDGLGKGYCVDRCLEAARRAVPHATGMLLDIGGDLGFHGEASPGQPWHVGVADPFHPQENVSPRWHMALAGGGALATSAHDARPLLIQGQRYAHIVDPRTGWPADAVASATVRAPDAMTANALAAALVVLGPEDGLALLAKTGCVGFLVTQSGRVHASAEMPFAGTTSTTPPTTKPAAKPTPAAAAWPDTATVDVGISLKTPDKAKRPFLAAWVETPAGQVVRTLDVWGQGKHIPEGLTDFWRKIGQARNKAGTLDAVSRASRSAGEYHLAWDGKDDAGNQTPPGNYVIHVECAREKGPRSHLKFQLACGGKTKAVQSAAGRKGDDLAEAAAQYLPKPVDPAKKP